MPGRTTADSPTQFRADTTTPLKPAVPIEPLPDTLPDARLNGASSPPAPTIQIAAVLEGFAISIAFHGKLEALPRYLAELRRVGATPTAQPALQWSYTPEGLPICPRHGAPMPKRSQQGDEWYSHNVGSEAEPCYCRGYRGKNSPGYEK